jgi:phage gp36-like protein
MRYAEASDLESPSLGLPPRALEDVDPDDTRRALEDASSLASGYLGRRFTLPLIAWGNDLKGCVCKIAAYNLLTGLGFNPISGSADEQVRLRYEDAMRWLTDVSKGIVYPDGLTDSSPPDDSSDDDFGTPEFNGYARRNWR